MTSQRFDQLFGGPPRTPESPLTQREMDLAASVQRVTEEIVLRSVVTSHPNRHEEPVPGGRRGPQLRWQRPHSPRRTVRRIWIQPAAGDAGGALGAALFIWYQLLGNERHGTGARRSDRIAPRSEFSDDEIRTFLDSTDAVYRRIARDEVNSMRRSSI